MSNVIMCHRFRKALPLLATSGFTGAIACLWGMALAACIYSGHLLVTTANAMTAAKLRAGLEAEL